MPSFPLTTQQAERARMLLEQNEVREALLAVREAGFHNEDDRLRDFASNKLAELTEMEQQERDGIADRATAKAARNALRNAVFAELSVRARAAPPNTNEARARRTEGAEDERRDAPPHEPVPGVIFDCKRLTKRFGKGFRLPEVTLELHHGEIAGVVGFNGAGKTTLLRMIAGDLARTEGTRWLGDEDDRERAIDHPVTYVPQSVEPWNGTLREHLRKQAAFFGHHTLDKNRRQVERVEALLGLAAQMEKTFGALSGGNQMRASIAAALLANPLLLVLDEPLAPLDPRAQQQLLRGLATRASTARTAIVISSQHVPEIESIADVMVTLSEEKAVTRRIDPTSVARGHLFDLGVSDTANIDRVVQQLATLQRDGKVTGWVTGASSVVVRFVETRRPSELLERFNDVGVTGIRDITGSSLAQQYADLSVARRERAE
ncbi:ATP-binding cassette domain-containing protein [Polyangium sorediatum]|uniref:ATP-binding cassette domain-containing protein n=1 Tax=Polyangium sorediatum TaxID=889274 RepID=A0ABT6NWQ1_9BACT|nr:ATP-binding cassette domain-containing protein [Polyangium sorediatum]MDI1432758.1 ATP-binding cassette domain-containing protein [Polyangium sorediatum]